jgi:hypothetical protein
MPEHGTEFETCEIVFWRGYVKCAFYAVPNAGEPLSSPFFRSKVRSPLPSGAALAAHQALAEQLAAEGWEPATRGPAWYSLAFRRRGWSPIGPEQLPIDELPPALPAVEAKAVSLPVEPQPVPAPAVETHMLAEPRPAADSAVAPSRLAARLAHKITPQQRLVLVASAALIALAIGLAVTLFGANSAQGNARSTQPRQQHRERLAAVPAARQTVKIPPTKIVVTGSRGESWVEARLGSATGRSLFAGVVSQGQTIRLTAPVVWITFGAAGNLDLRVNGKAPVPGTFNGTVTALIAHGRVVSA